MRTKIAALVLGLACMSTAMPAHALDNGVALTPPMGWNDWNTFGCNVSETLVRQTADVIVQSGMRDAGYRYVVIDDCWIGGRGPDGRLRANSRRFPHGMKAIGDFLHARGLKFGIYETPNNVTCAVQWNGYPPSMGVGSRGNEPRDAQTFASWGVDYLKYDNCRGERASFWRMRDALKETGRPIVYSVNPEFRDMHDIEKLPSVANMARIGEDIDASWDSVLRLIDVGANYAMLAGPGFWNDFDMLEVGRGMKVTEDRAHFAMWAMLASPLLAGNDVRKMSEQTREILTNNEIIAVDQDSLGMQALLKDEGPATEQVWTRKLAAPDTYAVTFLNRGEKPAKMELAFVYLGMGYHPRARVRDLWKHRDLGVFNGGFSTTVAPHDAQIYTFTRIP